MALITEVERIRSRIWIRLDSGMKAMLFKSDYAQRPFEAGEEVKEEEFRQWILLRQYRPALEKAVSMLALRACSQGEIEQRLRRSGYSEDTIEMVICKLQKEKLINDQEFAEQWTDARSNQKIGPRRIAQELRRKGVSAEETEQALAMVPEDLQLQQASALAEKAYARARANEDPRKTYQKILTSIVRRGYDWDTARQACERFRQELQEE